MTRISTLVILVNLLSSSACARRALNPTFAKVYKNVMAAQLQNRSSRALAPMKGDESKRIIQSYYGELQGANGAAASTGAGSSMTSGQSSPSPSSSNTNPFAFKVR
jgi:hypothetical protein